MRVFFIYSDAFSDIGGIEILTARF